MMLCKDSHCTLEIKHQIVIIILRHNLNVRCFSFWLSDWSHYSKYCFVLEMFVLCSFLIKFYLFFLPMKHCTNLQSFLALNAPSCLNVSSGVSVLYDVISWEIGKIRMNMRTTFLVVKNCYILVQGVTSIFLLDSREISKLQDFLLGFAWFIHMCVMRGYSESKNKETQNGLIKLFWWNRLKSGKLKLVQTFDWTLQSCRFVIFATLILGCPKWAETNNWSKCILWCHVFETSRN